ncbi:MAG: hypothetical protein V5A39_07640 [Haloarculaceae archaeon]
MKRRQVLAGCGAVLAGLGAGCGALSDSPPESPTPPPDTPSSTDDATPPDEPTTATPTGTPTPRTPDGPEGTPGSPGRSEARWQALASYRAGDETRDEYDESTRIARIGFERAKYGGAEIRYRDARESGEQAATYFDWAAGWAGHAGQTEAREIAESSAGYTRQYLIPFAERGIDASAAAKQGRLEEAREHVGEMRQILRDGEASDLEMAYPAVFENALR